MNDPDPDRANLPSSAALPGIGARTAAVLVFASSAAVLVVEFGVLPLTGAGVAAALAMAVDDVRTKAVITADKVWKSFAKPTTLPFVSSEVEKRDPGATCLDCARHERERASLSRSEVYAKVLPNASSASLSLARVPSDRSRVSRMSVRMSACFERNSLSSAAS